MQLTDNTGVSSWLQSLIRAVARAWLTIRYQLLDQRQDRIVIETINGVPLIVLPGVFNPVLFRSGAFLARMLAEAPLPAGARVLDMGTGSGLGAIFAARQGAQVTAVDINPEAVRCARLNILLNDLTGQVTVVEGDLFSTVANQRFDLILFNPPFYLGQPAADWDRAWRSQDVFKRFAVDLDSYLTQDGRALIILSTDGDGDQLLTLLEQAGFEAGSLARKNLVNEILTIYEVKRPPGAS
jgi:HemK-related putative methylase